MLLADPGNAPWLVRAALDAGDRGQAANIASVISETSRANPTFTAIRASTDYAEGLVASSLVSHGLTNQQIASQLFISTYTVAFHLRQVFRKLDIKSRVELTRIALEPAGAGESLPPGQHGAEQAGGLGQVAVVKETAEHSPASPHASAASSPLRHARA